MPSNLRNRTRDRVTAAALLAAVVFLALGASACREEAQQVPGTFEARERVAEGEPRTYELGFSALPVDLTDEAYVDAFDLAANYGEVLLIQRGPAWSEFLPGSSVSEERRDETLAERTALDERGLRLFYALDVFDPADRGSLASLPEGYEGRTLADPELREAFIAEARFIALNYRPAYLALGVEVNSAFERNPDSYRAFVDAYAEAYAAVKEASPTTLVFPTFQYEQLLGVVPWEPPHVPRWELLADFEGRQDVFAITTYPSFVYEVARKVPPDYYSQIRDHTALPIALASAGYASTPGREGLNSSTPAEQRRFLERLLTDADALQSPLVVWYAGRDPGFAQDPPLDLLASIGLRTSADEPKEAWPAWEEASNRPHEPAARDTGTLSGGG